MSGAHKRIQGDWYPPIYNTLFQGSSPGVSHNGGEVLLSFWFPFKTNRGPQNGTHSRRGFSHRFASPACGHWHLSQWTWTRRRLVCQSRTSGAAGPTPRAFFWREDTALWVGFKKTCFFFLRGMRFWFQQESKRNNTRRLLLPGGGNDFLTCPWM